jgi:hypothetical protein
MGKEPINLSWAIVPVAVDTAVGIIILIVVIILELKPRGEG